jgi:8-oxo-dGTP pyrophosphatase MutT (NUDIX family)
MYSFVGMECVNCGKLSHTFRDCTSPVMSFGICAVKLVGNVPHYLLIRRRDSLAYVEFMRGKYKMENRDYVQLLIDNMSVEEKHRLLTQPFDKLWDNVWNGQNTRQYRNEYEMAKRAFESLRNTGDIYGQLMSKYIEESPERWNEPEWGFPKGRRTSHESELVCALREFSEETGISNRLLHIVADTPSLIEEYTGTNGIPYKQVYFLGACASDTTAVHQPMNRVMSREVGNIGWFPYERAYELIRDTNMEKRALLERIHGELSGGDWGERVRNAVEWITAK